MIRLEDLQPNAAVRGLLPDSLVTVVSVQWFGSEALELTYKTPAGRVANELLYRSDEARLDLVEQGRPWSFDGDGALFRLVSEAHRIRLAHLFDPVLAVHTSLVDPLPHQITAVYESMLQRRLASSPEAIYQSLRRRRERLEELKLEAQISPLPPVVLGGLLVVPKGLLAAMQGQPAPAPASAPDIQGVAAKARAIVMEIERSLGFEPVDRELEKIGYDIESRIPGTGKLRFIEVKGRITGAPTITVTRNEILYSLNKPDDFILAIVEFFDSNSHRVHYLGRPFQREPDFGVTSVNYDFAELIARSEPMGNDFAPLPSDPLLR